jgi:hypothetical protein
MRRIRKMSELIEMPCGTGKTLEREFIKAYTEVQLDVEIKEESEDDGTA